jgi:hypothetical protein
VLGSNVDVGVTPLVQEDRAPPDVPDELEQHDDLPDEDAGSEVPWGTFETGNLFVNVEDEQPLSARDLCGLRARRTAQGILESANERLDSRCTRCYEVLPAGSDSVYCDSCNAEIEQEYLSARIMANADIERPSQSFDDLPHAAARGQNLEPQSSSSTLEINPGNLEAERIKVTTELSDIVVEPPPSRKPTSAYLDAQVVVGSVVEGGGDSAGSNIEEPSTKRTRTGDDDVDAAPSGGAQSSGLGEVRAAPAAADPVQIREVRLVRFRTRLLYHEDMVKNAEAARSVEAEMASAEAVATAAAEAVAMFAAPSVPLRRAVPEHDASGNSFFLRGARSTEDLKNNHFFP